MTPRRVEDHDRVRLVVSRAELETEIAGRIESAQDILARQINSWDELSQLERDFATWDEFNVEMLRTRFSTEEVADRYRRASFGGSVRDPARQEVNIRKSFDEQVRKLESISGTMSFYENVFDKMSDAMSSNGPCGDKIFIVHGHDGNVKSEVADFIQRTSGTRPVILHEQLSHGSSTIIEKFEENAAEAGFAIILLTGDDVGGVKGGATQ